MKPLCKDSSAYIKLGPVDISNLDCKKSRIGQKYSNFRQIFSILSSNLLYFCLDSLFFRYEIEWLQGLIFVTRYAIMAITITVGADITMVIVTPMAIILMASCYDHSHQYKNRTFQYLFKHFYTLIYCV